MTSFTCIHTNGVYQQYKGNICNRAFKCGSELPEYVALILRNGGSQSPDRWLRELRNNQYTYVTREVYEALVDTFRKEAHAQEMRDIRHTTKDGYTEGKTEDLVELTGESVEDTVIRQMEIETLQKAMQSLTPVQRERLHFYFFEGMTYRQIAAKEGVGEKNIRESINGAVKKIKKYFD